VFAAGYEDGKVEVFDAAHFNKLVVSATAGGAGAVLGRQGGMCAPGLSSAARGALARCTNTPLPPPAPRCCQRQTIPGSDSNEVSGLAWARGAGDPAWRLFASTLSGQVLELSCQQMTHVAATDSGGGPIWCLQAAPCSSSGSKGAAPGAPRTTTQLAAACGDGSVKLFGVHSGVAGAVYERALPRVEGNVLALAWHPSGASLVSGGSDGCIHVWEVATGARAGRRDALGWQHSRQQHS
jgi:WD40 repeat protein